MEEKKKREKISCEICGMMISKSNMSKHIRRHNNHPETFKETCNIGNTTLCCYCKRTLKNPNARFTHERFCHDNPNREISPFVKYNNRVDEMGNRIKAWNYGLTAETNESVLKQKKSLKQYYIDNPDHSSGGFREGTAQWCKYGFYKNIKCDSSWELAFLVYCIDAGFDIKRNKIGFDCFYDNKKHKYYPDFVVDGVFYEIKGKYREYDKCKIEQFRKNHTLVVIDNDSIKPYLRYAINKYGQDFTQIYDKDKSSFLDRKKKEA